MSLEELPVSYRERLAPMETIMGACVRANHVLKALARIPLTVLSNRRDDNVKAGAIEGQELALLERLACVLIVNCFAVLDSDQMTDDYLTMRLEGKIVPHGTRAQITANVKGIRW